MEIKEHSVLNGEIESSQESFLKKFECRKYSEFKIEGRVNNIKLLQEKPNLVAVSNFTKAISIFDTNLSKPEISHLDFSTPVLQLKDKESTGQFVSWVLANVNGVGIWIGLEPESDFHFAFVH